MTETTDYYEALDELAYWIRAADSDDDLPDETPGQAWERLTRSALDAAGVPYSPADLPAAANANRTGAGEGHDSESRSRLVLASLGCTPAEADRG